MRRPHTSFLVALIPLLLVVAVTGSLSYGGCEDYGGACFPALGWIAMVAWCGLVVVIIAILRRWRRN